MGPVVGGGAPTAVPPQEGARATWSTCSESRGAGHGHHLSWEPACTQATLCTRTPDSLPKPRAPSWAVPGAGLGGPRPGQAWVWLRPHWSRGRGGTGRRESARFCTLYSGLTLFKYLYPRCLGLDLCSTWFENVRGQESCTRCGEHELAAGHCTCGIRRAPRLMTSPGRARAPFALRPPGVGTRRPRAVDGACACPAAPLCLRFRGV